jgi:hypothetical protein
VKGARRLGSLCAEPERGIPLGVPTEAVRCLIQPCRKHGAWSRIWFVAHWTQNGRVVSTSESYLFTPNANVALVADFK